MDESISAQGETTGVSVGVGDVLGAAWASFTRRVGTYAGFGLIWVLGLLITMCGLVFCLAFPVGMMGSMNASNASPERMGGMIGFILVFYLVMFAAMAAIFAFHQGGTLSVAISDMRGREVSIGDALRGGAERIVPQSLFGLLRMLLDLCIFFGVLLIPAAIAFGTRGAAGAGDGADSLGIVAVTAIGFGYLVALVLLFVSRGFTGLGPSVIAAESLGAVAAFRRSSALLAGSRGAYYLAKLCVVSIGIAMYMVFGCVMFGVMAALGGVQSGSAPPEPAVVLVMFPMVLLFYGGLLAAYAFDHIVEAAFYVRLAKQPANADDVASVFR